MDNPEWKRKEQKRGREKYRKSGCSSKSNIESAHRYIYKFPEKRKAVTKAAKLERSFLGAHLHHWSYNQEHWLDVIEMTVKDHKKAHRFMVYDQERMMYRTTENILLDTREKHEKYIFDKIKNEED